MPDFGRNFVRTCAHEIDPGGQFHEREFGGIFPPGKFPPNLGKKISQ